MGTRQNERPRPRLWIRPHPTTRRPTGRRPTGHAVAEAVAAPAAYYGDGSTALDDDAYDRLVRRIAAYEEEHPGQVTPDSPTGKVVGGP
jgi:DNA ligase (NAD+)